MEKMKDILYDISDILLALLIIAVMTTVISWKLAGSLIGDGGGSNPSHNENAQSFQSLETPPVADDPEDAEEPPQTPSDLNPETETPDEVPVQEEPLQENPAFDAAVTIPSGTTGIEIAGILKNANLIASTNDFIDRIEARGLSAKLQSGSFTINSAKSLDEIIDILTGN